MSQITSAAILVGGKGTRLQSLMADVPKPLAPIAGRPFLDHILHYLAGQGIKSVVLLTGYKGDHFTDYEKRSVEFGIDISLSCEVQPMGTAGALKLAEPFLKKMGQNFLLVNGDTFFEGNLCEFLRPLAETEGGRLGLCWMDNASRYGLVERTIDGSISLFQEKKQGSSGWVNAGFVILPISILETIPAGKVSSLEQDVFPGLKNFLGYELSGAFFDIGLPESYSEFNSDVVLREAFKYSSFLGHILATWLQGGQIYVENLLSSISWPPEIHPIIYSSATQHFLNNAGPQDLILSRSRGQRLTSAHQIFIADGEELKGALENWKRNVEHLSVSKGRNLLLGAPWRPGLFLDRDGVVIEYVDYLDKPNQVRLQKGIVGLIQKAHEMDWAVTIVSNQSGLGREYYTWATYDLVTQKMLALLAQEGQFVDQTLCAPFFEKSQRAFGLVRPGLRKPSLGMVSQSARDLRIDLGRSVLVGDSACDIELGGRSGINRVYFLDSIRGEEQRNLISAGVEFQVIGSLDEVKL